MNNDDVELLDTSSASTTDVLETSSTVDNSQVSSNMTGDLNANGNPSISPFASKTTVVGTTANSPRISQDATFAATSHSMKQQAASKPNSTMQEKKVVFNDANLESKQNQDSTSKSIKPIFLIGAFVLLLVSILVLPYSKDFFDKIFSSAIPVASDDIQTGDLICTMESEKFGNSYQYKETYSFNNGKVDTLEHVVLIQGNADYLNQKSSECKILRKKASSFSGVTVECDVFDDEVVETQVFNLAKFDSTVINAEFTEAGGVSPNAKKGDSYKEIKRVMEMSNYDCEIK